MRWLECTTWWKAQKKPLNNNFPHNEYIQHILTRSLFLVPIFTEKQKLRLGQRWKAPSKDFRKLFHARFRCKSLEGAAGLRKGGPSSSRCIPYKVDLYAYSDKVPKFYNHLSDFSYRKLQINNNDMNITLIFNPVWFLLLQREVQAARTLSC